MSTATEAAEKQKRMMSWFEGDKSGLVFRSAIESGPCPFCLVSNVVTELPPWLKEIQSDGTTHVCHPALGGCNQGFARAPGESKRGDL